MMTTNGGPEPAATPLPQLNVVTQYIKDFSFENPHAPHSLVGGTQPPKIDIQISVKEYVLVSCPIVTPVRQDKTHQHTLSRCRVQRESSTDAVRTFTHDAQSHVSIADIAR